MISRVGLLIWLVVLWVVLWGTLSFANVVSGVAVGAALVLVFPLDRPPQPVALRPIATARFFITFAWKLVEASAIVAWEVVTPRNKINEGIVAVPITAVSDLVVTVVANAITLTPGTLTLEVDRERGRLYVHVLHLRDVEAVRHDIRHLEALAIRAFGSARAIAEIDAAEAAEGVEGPDVADSTEPGESGAPSNREGN